MKFSVSIGGFSQNQSISTIIKGLIILPCILILLSAIFLHINTIATQSDSSIDYARINTLAEKLIHGQGNIQPMTTPVSQSQYPSTFQLPHQTRANRLLEQQQTSKTVQKYILLLIIVFFVVVPVTATLIFLGLFIYKKCTQTQDQLQPAAQVNIEQFNIDEVGPYLVNSTDNCSICLDNLVNIRTLCGHFFHAPCLKAWFQKKAQQNRKPTCPVCVGQATNPIKIYCKKCFVSVKLDKLIYVSSQQTVNQFDTLQCNECKQPQNDTSFTQNSANDNSITDNEHSVYKNGQIPEGYKNGQIPESYKNGQIPERANRIVVENNKAMKIEKKNNCSDKIEEQMNSNVKIHVNNDI